MIKLTRALLLTAVLSLTFATAADAATKGPRLSVSEGTARDAMICNGRYLGGGMMMCPEAEPDDGLFDVLLIGDVTKRDLAFVLPKTYKGKHLPHPRLELLRGSVVTIESEEPLPIELDGEQPGTTPVRFEVVPRALRLRVPATG